MPGRAKGKRFVIRGKERLDVGFQEDEFLLQAVFYCMGAGPNPDCRAPMLAPRRRQNLITPSGHANSPAQIPPAGRPWWRLAAGKSLSHRRATPTVRPESRPAAVHVGAAPSAKPYPTVGPRQQASPKPARRPSMLAPPRRQNLIPPPGHANRPAQIPPAGRPCWRRPAGKALSHRRATPTGRPESRPAAVHVGAAPSAKPYPTAGKTLFHRRATPTGQPESCPAAVHVGAAPPAKPYPTAGPRQQSGPNPACRPSMLALSRRQSLIPPPAKPYPTAGPRQQAVPNPARQPPMLPLPLAGGRRL